jgi:hypothetical protein
MRLNVDCTLIPVRQPSVVGDIERITRDERERICGRATPDEIPILRKLKISRGLLAQSLLDQNLRGCRSQQGYVLMF